MHRIVCILRGLHRASDRVPQNGGTDVSANSFVFGDPEMADDSGFVRQSLCILLSAVVEEPIWIDVHRRYGIIGPIGVIVEHEIGREELRDRCAYRSPARFGRVDENQLEPSHDRPARVKQKITSGHIGTPTTRTAGFISRVYRSLLPGRASKCVSRTFRT